jgi:hypothetical protein
LFAGLTVLGLLQLLVEIIKLLWEICVVRRREEEELKEARD